jgi:hypothetical protein
MSEHMREPTLEEIKRVIREGGRDREPPYLLPSEILEIPRYERLMPYQEGIGCGQMSQTDEPER